MDNFENELKNIDETDNTSGSPITSIDNTLSDNNVPVRNRVSSWLTDIVGEVRKKSASVSIPKWVETSNTGNSFQSCDTIDGEKNESCDSSIAQEIKNFKINEGFSENSTDNNLSDTENIEKNIHNIESENRIPSRFWNKFSFDKNSPNQNQNSTSAIDKVSQIKTFGKTKFNEIYEKVKISKEKLPILRKSPSTMEEILNTTEKRIVNEEEKDEILAQTFINQNNDESLNANSLTNEVDEGNKISEKIENLSEVSLESNSNEENISSTDFEINLNNNISKEKEEISKKSENITKNTNNSNNLEENSNISDNDQSLSREESVHETKLKIPLNENDGKIQLKNFQRNLKLGNLGRSSTLNPKYFCDDGSNNDMKYDFPSTSSSLVTPIEEEQILAIPAFVSSTPSSKSKKRHLPFSSIYRSFSEQQPDIIDESEEFLNERSHSCYQVTEGQDSDDKESKINKNESVEPDNAIQNIENKRDAKNNISTSLPTFSTTNMIQHLKGSRKPEIGGSTGGSHGDSSSSLCMDISPCGSGSGTSTSDPRELYLRRRSTFVRDNSYQSDSSHCSSVDSLLEARKPDPESILINLGFGPIDSEDILAKIPKRFLKPSQVRGIDTEAFLRRQQLMNSIHDHSVLGYRGLLGNPDIPPSVIVGKIMERFEQNERNRWNFYEYNRPLSAPPNSMEVQKFNYNS